MERGWGEVDEGQGVAQNTPVRLCVCYKHTRLFSQREAFCKEDGKKGRLQRRSGGLPFFSLLTITSIRLFFFLTLKNM
jgi:hypothetical protein